MKLSGKAAIVTGAARGIGKEIAAIMLAEGASVLLSDVLAEELEKTAGELSAKGTVHFLVGDVTKQEDADKMVSACVEKFGKLDVLVNNAGITRDNLLMRMKEDDWDLVLSINLKGAYICSKAALKQVMRNKGSIINIASIVGQMGNAGQCNYSASKAGLIGFTKSLAREIARKGARVNAIAPGFIRTAMTDQMPEKAREEMIALIPMNKLGTPEDIAKAAVFLASDESGYVTGQVLALNGGMYM